jgi:hypothetical protein
MIDTALIQMIRNLLEKVESGKIQSVAIAASGPENLQGYLANYIFSGNENEFNSIRTQLSSLCWIMDQRIGHILPTIDLSRFR